MRNVRAAVVSGVFVIPVIAVAGLSQIDINLKSLFSRTSPANSVEPITQKTGVVMTEYAANSNGLVSDPSDDPIQVIRMHQSIENIIAQSMSGDANAPKAIESETTLTFDGAAAPADSMQVALGVSRREHALNLTDNVTPTQSNDIEPTNESIMLNGEDFFAGAVATEDSLASAMFPGIAANELLNAGNGVVQQAQAPIVERVARGNAGFSGDEGSSNRAGLGARLAAALEGVEGLDESFTKNESGSEGTGEVLGDVPAPGATSIGLIALVGLRRRRN